MPELPDVQVFKEYLERSALHRRIEKVEIGAPEILEDTDPRALAARLTGAELVRARRHGKYLFAEVDGGGWLLLHFGMTGELEYSREEPPADHIRLRLDFADGSHLAFRDVRKLGRMGLVEDVDEYIRKHRLGPDPLDEHFDRSAFRKALEGRKTAVKTALINQEVMAGIGNIYADEILFQAGIHPETRADAALDQKKLDALYRATERVLKAAIAARADPARLPDSFLLPHREEGGRCPRCGGVWKKIKVGGRPAYFCPRDQKK